MIYLVPVKDSGCHWKEEIKSGRSLWSLKGKVNFLKSVVIGFKTLIINLHLGSIDIFKVVDKVPGQVPHLWIILMHFRIKHSRVLPQLHKFNFSVSDSDLEQGSVFYISKRVFEKYPRMLYKKKPEEFPNCKTDDVEDGQVIHIFTCQWMHSMLASHCKNWAFGVRILELIRWYFHHIIGYRYLCIHLLSSRKRLFENLLRDGW